MTSLYAQPYDISATGFYFESVEEYEEKQARCRNDFGGIVEEFEIQFIDGEAIDAELFEAARISQADFEAFLDACDTWDDEQKVRVICACENGYTFSMSENYDELVDLYEVEDMLHLAHQAVEDGWFFGEAVPDFLENYIDYEVVARDLGMEWTEITVAGNRYVYKCG